MIVFDNGKDRITLEDATINLSMQHPEVLHNLEGYNMGYMPGPSSITWHINASYIPSSRIRDDLSRWIYSNIPFDIHFNGEVLRQCRVEQVETIPMGENQYWDNVIMITGKSLRVDHKNEYTYEMKWAGPIETIELDMEVQRLKLPKVDASELEEL